MECAVRNPWARFPPCRRPSPAAGGASRSERAAASCPGRRFLQPAGRCALRDTLWKQIRRSSMHADQGPLCDVIIAPVVTEDAGELLTLQRASYATEARIYGDPELPALTQTLPELEAELATVT